MRYKSTRGNDVVESCDIALLNGIATDGGLYLPEHFPCKLPLNKWKNCSFSMILTNILELFFEDISIEVRNSAVDLLLSRFPENQVPVVTKGDFSYIELFHGPTGSFKDVSFSILPYLLKESARLNGKANIAILTATSGDTGPAAMCGFNGISGISVLVFFPQIGISLIQERQMTCQEGKNTFTWAMEGNSDDAQRAVKLILGNDQINEEANKAGITLSSANSINIGHLFPQVSYYFHAAAELMKQGVLAEGQLFDITVPTGNFGNLLAAFYAKKLGCPIDKMIVASNENSVVADFIETGVYNSKRDFKITNTPSMDILISSNVERLLFELLDGDVNILNRLLTDLQNNGSFTLPELTFKKLQKDFSSGFADENQTLSTIKHIWKSERYLVDPHTAVGVKIAEKYKRNNVPMAIVATATPWKFASTMCLAINEEVGENIFEDIKTLSNLTANKPLYLDLENKIAQNEASCSPRDAEKVVKKLFDF